MGEGAGVIVKSHGMNINRVAHLFLIGLLVVALPAPAQDAGAQPIIKALIVDGFSNHDWRKTSGFIDSTLTATGMFEVAVSTSPGEPDSPGWDQWRPVFTDYDVVVLNSNNIQQRDIRWPRRVEQDLEAYVRDGGGLLIFHSANNAFAHWGEYDRMIGLGWRDKDHGIALQLDASGKIRRIPAGEGEGTSHGPRQDTLAIRLTDHPITRGTPKRWMTPDIEVFSVDEAFPFFNIFFLVGRFMFVRREKETAGTTQIALIGYVIDRAANIQF